MTKTPSSLAGLPEARAAFHERRWEAAFDVFSASDDIEALGGEDLERYGETAWWLGRLGLAIEIRERGYHAFKAADEPARAGRMALYLAADQSHRNEGALASGWRSRAARLLEGLPVGPAHAWLERAHLSDALDHGDLEGALVIADRILDLGRRLGDADIEAVGLQDRGRVLLAMGRVDEGMDNLSEAVVAVGSDDVSPSSTAIVYCNATVACEDLTDFRRAAEFADEASRWCDREDITGFPGMCRVRRVEIIRLKGDWARAELEARKACEELKDFSLDYAAEGFYQIGEIRLRLGDHAEAEEAFSKAHRLGREPLPGLAVLRHAQGDRKTGSALLAHALADANLTPLARARLLPAEAASALDMADPARARKAAVELDEIAGIYQTHLLRAQAQQARGMVAMLDGDTDLAIAAFRDAIIAWQATDAPWEVAHARMLLGEVCVAAGEPGVAALELTAARSTFTDLGAEGDARHADQLTDGTIQPRIGTAKARRTQRTFMFTDIVRSTNLVEAVGDEAWERLLAWHDTTIRRLLGQYHGQEVDHAGDGFFVAFHSADDALDCALTIRSTLIEHREKSGFAPSVRIGLHTAEALQTAEGYAGGAIHTAARVGALAGGEEIIVSRPVIEGAERARKHGSWRKETLKGLADPVEVTALE